MDVKIEIINVLQTVNKKGDGYTNFRVKLSGTKKVPKRQCILRFHIEDWELILDKHKVTSAKTIGEDLHVDMLTHVLVHHFKCQNSLLRMQKLCQN